MIVGPIAYGETPYSEDEINRYMRELMILILPVLDQKLHDSIYICGEHLTVADIVLYNEISTVLTLHKKEITEMVALNKWY